MENKEVFIQITKTATEVLEFMAGSSLAINLLFGVSMSKLWAMINGLQVINHYPLFFLVAPYNLGIVQAAFRKITSFDFESEDFFKENVWLIGKEPMTPDYFHESAGYDSYLTQFSLGLPMYYFFICVLAIIMALLLRASFIFLCTNNKIA